MIDLDRLLIGQIGPLRRYARALVHDREAADDLVQSCLERAWSRSHLLRSEEEVRTWLFTILHNLFVSELRQKSREPVFAPNGGRGDGGSCPAPQEQAAAMVDLERALAGLEAEQRAAVLLVGVEDLSYREAALVLGIPVGTLMSRLHRGRQRLRALMDGEVAVQLKRVK